MQLLDANLQYANICYRDGRESSISLSDLSPCPQGLNSRETELQFPILNEEDPQTSPVQRGKDDLLHTTLSKSTMQRQSGDAPPHQHKDSLQQDDHNSFLSAPSESTVHRSTSQLSGFHRFDMESRFLIKRGRLLCNCNCSWSSLKHVLDLSFCTVRFISRGCCRTLSEQRMVV